MIQEETPLTNEDIRLLKTAGRITGIRWLLLLLFTAITLVLAALLLMAACGRQATLYIPVSAAWGIVMGICFFMWRSALKQRHLIRAGLHTGKKRILRLRIRLLHVTPRGELQYISATNDIVDVKPALPDKSFFYEQQNTYHPAIVKSINGQPGQEVVLHVSTSGNILLKAEYPHTPFRESTARISNDDQLLMKEKQSTLVKLFLTSCTGLALILLLGGIARGYYSNLYIVIGVIYLVFFLLATPAYYVYNSYSQAESKVVIRGKVTEIISTMRPNRGTGDVYYRVGDKLYLVRPIENLGTSVQAGNEVELHFIRKRNGQPGRMLYDIKC
ncbi:hypothetical protein [Chitinophaga ginsengisoli]|uniref:Uncharacterized protein n=1 Tax=Chitinophaga ginsengisoli TaxID=363837 RepID=A0A2P8FC21_9BACT|nr:hypothetical protein [Chitinophaga ginsengisoli]PSL19276.1 hypothetical protein CLV42_12810 [Chitinophaga ginsengisoli]